jgi:hypothetical protein
VDAKWTRSNWKGILILKQNELKWKILTPIVALIMMRWPVRSKKEFNIKNDQVNCFWHSIFWQIIWNKFSGIEYCWKYDNYQYGILKLKCSTTFKHWKMLVDKWWIWRNTLISWKISVFARYNRSTASIIEKTQST